MTTKSDFTEEEWRTVLQGPTSAGLLVVASDPGGSVRETLRSRSERLQSTSRASNTIPSPEPVIGKSTSSETTLRQKSYDP